MQISPKTKIGELLDAYPELEESLMQMSPAFAKLKNPLLRKTIGRIATLQQAAAIGNIPVEKIVNLLREKTGQGSIDLPGSGSQENNVLPGWFNEQKIKIRYDAIPVIHAGQHPMGDVMKKMKELKTGEIMELKTPFLPAPIIDMIREKGHQTWSRQAEEEIFLTYIAGPDTEITA